jgi:hypothetical protein
MEPTDPDPLAPTGIYAQQPVELDVWMQVSAEADFNPVVAKMRAALEHEAALRFVKITGPFQVRLVDLTGPEGVAAHTAPASVEEAEIPARCVDRFGRVLVRVQAPVEAA